MSWLLWKYLLEDDLPNFRQALLGPGAPKGSIAASGGYHQPQQELGLGIGSPPGAASFGTSPSVTRSAGISATSAKSFLWSRAELNRRDPSGLTLLHVASSSRSPDALEFVNALLEQLHIDLYLQDLENGWTALHRAFYFGNIAIARSILRRENQDALHLGSGGVNHRTGGLIRIKDYEGNGPLDLYAATVMDRSLRRRGENDSSTSSPAGVVEDDEDSASEQDLQISRPVVEPSINIQGDEVFTFGSNKNITLGFGDQDDRQHPECISLARPDRLLRRFHLEHLNAAKSGDTDDFPSSAIPAVVRFKPLVIQDVQMAKLHSAVLTTDPESNLYICGHGPGGRLGLGDEKTRYKFVCVDRGVLTGKRIVAVGLGQNHTLAVSDNGDLFSWGTNTFGQLGYALADVSHGKEEPIQLEPRQVYNPLKREVIIGVAASRIHSAAFTADSLYTFGKNEGQLGLMDADARSLKAQVTPRKVAVSLFRAPISSVTAIERATICLLSSHEVFVFANYGYVKLNFDLSAPSSDFFRQSFLVTQYNKSPNVICKITAGGNTICAMSSTGEVYTCVVSQATEPGNAAMSTTSPIKIRDAISKPARIWSLRKRHMAARDVAVDHDGSIVLVTDSGSVWRGMQRAQKTITAVGLGEERIKAHKFSRVSGLTRVLSVRASAHGAYAAVRKDCDVTKSQITVDEKHIYNDLYSLLSFRNQSDRDDLVENPSSTDRNSRFSRFTEELVRSKTREDDVSQLIQRSMRELTTPYDMELVSSSSSLRIPLYEFVLASRSPILRRGLRQFRETGSFALPGILSIERNPNDVISLILQDMDFLTLLNVVHFLHTDYVLNVWDYPLLSGVEADKRHMKVRSELMRLAARLEMPDLEVNARLMTMNSKMSLCRNMEEVVTNSDFLETGDILVKLSDGEMRVHRALVCQRCPYFATLFQGRAGGSWLQNRFDSPSRQISVDLTEEVDCKTFQLVLRHIYADSGQELFDGIVTSDLDEFIDAVMGVMIAADFLMLNRLLQVCQEVIGHYVNARNVCQLINDIAASSVPAFKEAGLEYICLNLEAVLHNRSLDELDESLLDELDQAVRDNQRSYLRFARSDSMETSLLEDHPELEGEMNKARQQRINSLKGAIKPSRPDSSRLIKVRRMSSNMGRETDTSPSATPELKSRSFSTEMIFDMDDENELPGSGTRSQAKNLQGSRSPDVSSRENQWQTPKKGSRSRPSELAFGSPSPHSIGSPLVHHAQPSSIGAVASRAPSQPWGTLPLSAPKQDMKDIMSQTPSKKSNLTLGLAAQDDRPNQLSASFNVKMSQKERKRLQAQKPDSAPASAPATATAAAASPSNGKPQSPWRSVSSGAKVSLRDIQVATAASTEPSSSRPPPSSSQLTMRQTIANGPGSSPVEANREGRRGSNIAKSNANEPSLQLTMADILSQQQAEKDFIKEAKAKRSLKDIQLEQQFEQWWNKESKKIQDEQKAASAGGPSTSKKANPGKRNRKPRKGEASTEGKN